MNCNELELFIRRDPMDRAMIVEQLMHHCKRFIDNILQAADLSTLAAASLAIVVQMREVARVLLQAKVDLEAHKLQSQPVQPCCPEAALHYMHTRTVQPTTLFG